ncbi:tumor necrosis factor receptor superfamily [Pimephales promelas]|nr:tumor necrosis factor receptor superfamily [Pimephales promelas]
MAWACTAANGTGSLVFIDDVTADKSSRMNSEVFRAILSAHIQPNASELIGRRFTVQMDNDPKHTAKEFFKRKKWNVMQWPNKTEGKCPKNKQELKTVAIEAWQSISRDETQHLVMSMRSRHQAESEFIRIAIVIVRLNYDLCFCRCAHAEYEIDGQCCPMCAPGNCVVWHCTDDTSTTCVPCPEFTYTDEPNGLTKCFTCAVCDARLGVRIKRSCTRSADTVCEPLEGFYCIEQNKGSCTYAVQHSECHHGQYIIQAGTAFTDTVCDDCMEGTYSNGSLTTCQPHSICESEGLKEIKPGTMSSDVECGKSVSVSIIVGVIAAIIIGVLVTAVGIKIYCKLKQKRDSNGYLLPMQESNSTVAEERPVPEGACEPDIHHLKDYERESEAKVT